ATIHPREPRTVRRPGSVPSHPHCRVKRDSRRDPRPRPRHPGKPPSRPPPLPPYRRPTTTRGGAMTPTVMRADDHQITRQGLRAILNALPEFQLIGEASDGLEAVRLAERLRPDVLVLDLSMPGLDGLEVSRQVTKKPPRPRVVVLSMYSDEAYVLKALQA